MKTSLISDTRCRQASRENWLSRSLVLRSQVGCLLVVAIRPNGTIRRAFHQSPGKVTDFAI
jgi:hypothetical protein